MIGSLRRAGGPLAPAFPVIFWEDTELSFRGMKVTGFEVPSASHQGPSCPMGEPLSEPGQALSLPRRSTRPTLPRSAWGLQPHLGA